MNVDELRLFAFYSLKSRKLVGSWAALQFARRILQGGEFPVQGRGLRGLDGTRKAVAWLLHARVEIGRGCGTFGGTSLDFRWGALSSLVKAVQSLVKTRCWRKNPWKRPTSFPSGNQSFSYSFGGRDLCRSFLIWCSLRPW